MTQEELVKALRAHLASIADNIRSYEGEGEMEGYLNTQAAEDLDQSIGYAGNSVIDLVGILQTQCGSKLELAVALLEILLDEVEWEEGTGPVDVLLMVD